MATRTLLEMTQDILSRMSSDEVNSISDTAESLQIATIIKNKYFDIVARGDLPANEKLFQLTPSDDIIKPVLMYVPDGVITIEWLKYFDKSLTAAAGTQHGYQYVTLLPIDQFIDMSNAFNPTETTVGTFSLTTSSQNFTFYYKNNHQPKYATIIANTYVIFDSYDKTLDSTLQASKTMCFGQTVTPFSMTDNFIPDIDDNQFALLFNESLAVAFFELKQIPNAKAEQEIKRQWGVVQKNKSVDNKPGYFDQLPSFGRMPRTGGYGGYTYGPRLFS